MPEKVQRFSPKEWILAMLFAGNGVIRGKTRLQKGVFIISREIDSIETPEFKPYDYGPYSPELEKALNELVKEGLVKTRIEPGGDESPVVVIYWTEKGREEAEKAWRKLQENPEFKRIKLRLDFAINAPLTVVLAYVYGMYQDFVSSSKIKHKVNLWRRVLGY